MNDRGGELWTTEQVAHFLGIRTINGAHKAMRRWKIKPSQREPGREGQNLYDAEAVRREQARRTGQGRRTDLD